MLDGKCYYAYAGPGGTVYRSDDGKTIGAFKAFMMGLPTEWPQRLLNVVLLLLPMVFLLPVLLSFPRRRESRGYGKLGTVGAVEK